MGGIQVERRAWPHTGAGKSIPSNRREDGPREAWAQVAVEMEAKCGHCLLPLLAAVGSEEVVRVGAAV